MSTLSAIYDIGVRVTETLAAADTPFIDTTDDKVKTALRATATLTGESIPAVTKKAEMQVAMSGGAATIDLTALTNRGVAVTFNTLKVKVAVFRNPAANGNAITIAEGAANGNALLGSAFSITLQPGQVAAFFLKDSSQTVGGSDKNIDITGTLTQALDVLLLAG